MGLLFRSIRSFGVDIDVCIWDAFPFFVCMFVSLPGFGLAIPIVVVPRSVVVVRRSSFVVRRCFRFVFVFDGVTARGACVASERLGAKFISLILY